MRTFFLVLTLVAVGFIAVNRQRLYLRDPLGAVYRNDVKQPHTRVFINYSNDVLVQHGENLQMEEYAVQGWNGVPGVPVELKCLQELACLASADHMPMSPLAGSTRAQMTNRQVSFTDETNKSVRIVLR